MQLDSFLRFSNITLDFDQRSVLSSVSLSLPTGGLVLLTGDNGSGKSSLLKIMAGLIAPNSGHLHQNTQQTSIKKAQQWLLKAFTYFHQSPYMFDTTVYNNIDLLQQTKISPAMIDDALAFAGINHLSNQSARQLSGGEKQRVAIARARLSDAHYLLFDEPTANLDLSIRKNIITLISELKSSKKTVIIACHQANEFSAFSDQIYRIENGHLLDTA